jgi:hypothetical protein
MRTACPSCPDGYVWTREGPTGKACPTCKGLAYIGEDDNEDNEDSEIEADAVGECEPPAF